MKFDMSEAWREAVAMLSANREVLLIVAGIFFLLPSLVSAMILPGVQEAIISDPENAEAVMNDLVAEWGALLFVVGFAVVLAQIVGYLSLLALLRDSSRPTVGDALRTGISGLLPAIGTYLLFAFGLGLLFSVLIGGSAALGNGPLMVVGLMVSIVITVYVCVKVSLSGPVIAIDKVFNPFAVLARSWRLTKGNSFRLFLFYLLLFIVYFVVSIVVAGVLGALILTLGSGVALTVNGIVSGIISAVVTVVFIAVIAAVHRQLAGPSAAAVSETFE